MYSCTHASILPRNYALERIVGEDGEDVNLQNGNISTLFIQIIGFIEVLFQQKKMLLLERAIMEKSTLAGRIDSSLTVQFFIRAKDPEPLEISEEEHVGQE